jgi:cell division transport system permease protein
MKLVGATPSFIRRPFVVNNIFHGIFAAVIASALLAALLYYAHSLDASVAYAIGWESAVWVFAAMLVAGIAICTAAALFATNRYLRLSYDDMFK